MAEDYVLKLADFGLTRNLYQFDYYRKTTDVSRVTVNTRMVIETKSELLDITDILIYLSDEVYHKFASE